MKLSFSTMATPELTAIQSIKIAQQCGYNGIDLRMRGEAGGEMTLDMPQQQITEIKKAASEQQIELVSLFCYNKTILDGKDECLNSIQKHIETAQNLGVSAIRLFTGNTNEPAALQQLTEVLAQASRENKTDVQILLQNHYTCSPTAINLCKIIQLINSPKLRLAFSPDHLLQNGVFDQAAANAAMPLASQIYVSDKSILTGKDTFPGEGDVPFISLKAELKAFKGYVTFKWERCWRPSLCSWESSLPYFISWCNENFV